MQLMKKIFQKTYKFRLRPTREQQQLCAQFSGASRFVFNFGLECIKRTLDAGTEIPNFSKLCKKLTQLKDHKPWLRAVHGQMLQQALKDLDRSLNAWLQGMNKNNKKPRAGFPTFKKRHRRSSFRYPQFVRCENGSVYLPKIGWVPYYDSQSVEGIIKQATVKRQGNHWFVCITCDVEMEVPEIKVTKETVKGIDVGLTHLVTTSDGLQIPSERHLKRLLGRVRHLSQALSRKIKRSSNWKKCLDKLRRLHIKIANMRADFLHKLSTMLTENQGASMICVEDLNIKGLMKNPKLSRAIADASWGTLYRFLEYKCLWKGMVFKQIDQFYPSSKLCSGCGNKQEMPLSMREFHCAACELKLDRDINAAINIRSAGITELNACRETRVGGFGEAGICGF